MVGKLAVSLGMLSGWQTESAVCISHPNGKKENTFSWF